jgi:hypothetical protein
MELAEEDECQTQGKEGTEESCQGKRIVSLIYRLFTKGIESISSGSIPFFQQMMEILKLDYNFPDERTHG